MKNKKRILKVLRLTGLTASIAVIFMSANAFAANVDTTQLDNVIKWLATWVSRVGLVVAFFGGIQTSLGFKNDDADSKVRGLKTLVSGFMVFGISQSLDLFGL